jgi:hypothetical protein
MTDIDVAVADAGRIIVGYTSADRDQTRLVAAKLSDLFATAPERERTRRQAAQSALDSEIRDMAGRLERATEILNSASAQGQPDSHASSGPTASSVPAATAAGAMPAAPAGGRAVLETEVRSLQGQYDELVSKRAALDVVPQLPLAFEILAQPEAPRRPWDRTAWRRVTLFGVVGLLLGAALAVLLRSRGVRFRKPDDVLAAIGLPVLAVVPEMATGRRIVTPKRMSVVALTGSALAVASLWWWRSQL